MISGILSAVTGFITHTISALGYPGIALLMAIQTIAVPMPSEVIIPFAGFLASTGRFNLWLVAITGGLGSCAGSFVAYQIGLKGGRPLVEKYGRMILISRHDLETADRFFIRNGSSAAFFGMMLPVFRSFISFPAGISKVPVKKFLFYVFAGSFLWSLSLGYLGMKLGEHWPDLRMKFQKFDYLIAAVIIFGVSWWVWRHIKNKNRTTDPVRKPAK